MKVARINCGTARSPYDFFKKTIKMTADNGDNGRIMLAVV